MRLGDPDPSLRAFERDAVVACSLMAIGAVAVQGGRLDGAAGVLAGGLLMALSYRAIKGGVDLLARTVGGRGQAADEGGAGSTGARPGRRTRAVVTVLKFLSRYALLAVGAYVMLACFRLHPAGLLAGATAPFVAAALQLVRMARATARRKQS